MIKQVEAAEILSLSSRHIRRVIKPVKVKMNRGMIPKSRGRPSNRIISGTIKDKVPKLYRSRYKFFKRKDLD